MVLPLWQRFRQYSLGSLKTSSWVTVHEMQAIGIASKNNQAVCVSSGIHKKCRSAKKVLIRKLLVLSFFV